jgi:hypothetical protein
MMTRRRTIDVAGEPTTRQRAEPVLTTSSGIHRVDVDQEGKTVDIVVDQDMRDDELIATLRGAGYQIVV